MAMVIIPGDLVDILPDGQTRERILRMRVRAAYPLLPGRVELRGTLDLTGTGTGRPADLTLAVAEQDVRLVVRGTGQPEVSW